MNPSGKQSMHFHNSNCEENMKYKELGHQGSTISSPHKSSSVAAWQSCKVFRIGKPESVGTP